MKHTRWFAGISLACLLGAPAGAVTRYVSPLGSDIFGMGTIDSPFSTIQYAINLSDSGDVVELADGIYAGVGNVYVIFNGKAVVVRSTSGSPQACIVDGSNTAVAFQFVGSEPPDCAVEGITIQNCRLVGVDNGEGQGSAIRISGDQGLTSPTFRNCIFKDNKSYGGDVTGVNNQFDQYVHGFGGAVYAFNSKSVFINCSFIGNQTFGGKDDIFHAYAGKGLGGAVGARFSELKFIGCAFSQNSSTGGMDGSNDPVSYAGAVYVEDGKAQFEGCTFTRNSSVTGGAVYVKSGLLSAVNCLFVLNESYLNGGAAVVEGANLSIINSSFANNEAFLRGGAILVIGGGTHTIDNSILYGNIAALDPQYTADSGGLATFSYSFIQGSGGSGSWFLNNAVNGGFNLDGNPGFLRDPGTNGALDLGDLRLMPTSICVDSGSNAKVPSGITTDLDGESRIFRLVVDMGAYEFHVSPLQLINELRAAIDDLVAEGASLPGQAKGLKATLSAAMQSLTHGDNNGAVGALGAFQNQCQALVSAKRLTQAQADELIARAQEIIDIIR